MGHESNSNTARAPSQQGSSSAAAAHSVESSSSSHLEQNVQLSSELESLFDVLNKLGRQPEDLSTISPHSRTNGCTVEQAMSQMFAHDSVRILTTSTIREVEDNKISEIIRQSGPRTKAHEHNRIFKIIRKIHADFDYGDSYHVPEEPSFLALDRGTLTKPLIVVWDHIQASHKHLYVILPQNYQPPRGPALNNRNEVIFFIDPYRHDGIPDRDFIHFLQKNESQTVMDFNGTWLVIGDTIKMPRNIANDTTADVKIHFKGFNRAEVRSFNPRQQLHKDDSELWILYNAIMLISTGNTDYFDQFTPRMVVATNILRHIFPGLKSSDAVELCSPLSDVLLDNKDSDENAPSTSASAYPNMHSSENMHGEQKPDTRKALVTNLSAWINQSTCPIRSEGYVTDLHLYDQHKCIQEGFTWSNIKMLAVITGKNGIGKTRLLEAIVQQLTGLANSLYSDRTKLATMDIVFRNNTLKYQPTRVIPQVFCINSSSDAFFNTKAIEEAHQKEFTKKFEDLRDFHAATVYGYEYTLKFPELRAYYQEILKKFTTSRAKKATNSASNVIQNAFYSDLEVFLQHEEGLQLATYSSLEDYPKYLLEQLTSIDDLNKHLISYGFKYQISPNSMKNRKVGDLNVCLLNTSEPFSYKSLSPGQKLEFLVLLWLYDHDAMKKQESGAILILDEPDAHLEPALVKEFIAIVLTRLIGVFGIQVIMTTHSPTTVSMLPKENIFIMSSDPLTHTVSIETAKSQKQAIQRLTADFVFIHQKFRLVFVEGRADKVFYDIVYRSLIQKGYLDTESYLYFTVHGTSNSKNNQANKDSSKSTVERIVKHCVLGDETCPLDVDTSLGDFISGVVDGDSTSIQDEIPNVYRLDRYSIENYIYDPIYVYFFLLKKYLKNELKREEDRAKFVELQRRACHHLPSSDSSPDSLASLLDGDRQTSQMMLQAIIDAVEAQLTPIIQHEINHAGCDLAKIIKTHRDNRLFKLVDDQEQLIVERKLVEFTNGYRLSYPQYMLYMKGHALCDYGYKRFFPCIETITPKKIDPSIPITRLIDDYSLIPRELLTIFSNLQHPSATITPQTQPTKINRKREKQKQKQEDTQDDTSANPSSIGGESSHSHRERFFSQHDNVRDRGLVTLVPDGIFFPPKGFRNGRGRGGN